MKINSEQEMLDFGKEFAKKVEFPMVIELIGDVGAGKTTFTRGLAEGLNAKEQPNNKKLIHYDFYRLPDPGLMSEELNESINDQDAITVIEWGESVAGILPEDRIIMKIEYTENGNRIITF